TMINMAFCWLILISTAVQKLVFGELRVSEQQHLKDKFWNFVFYKFIFVFGIINVQYIDEVLLWCSWFAFLGFLHLLSQLSKDRFEYLSFSPTTPLWSHVKLLALLGIIFALSGFMLLVSVFVGFFGGFNTFAFMSAEVVLLSIRTLHVIIRYALHLYDMRQEGASSVSTSEESKAWEKRGPIAYYTELTFELLALIIDFIHHLHMLVWSNIFLSMASLVICMQLRYLFHEIQRRYKKHRNYLWVRNHLEQNTCLLSWLEQDTSCPTCRLSLNIQNPSSARIDPPELQVDVPQPQRRPQNHFFHFDGDFLLQFDVTHLALPFLGSRYVSWLPSFSVEVSHAQQNGPVSNSQWDAMARQVQQLFPHIPISTITTDLRMTRSVEMTIENVLDGRLVAPAMFREREVNPPMSMSVLQANAQQPRSWDEFNTDTADEFNTDAVE
ncbi:E3 ubiquitin-protein ligase AMFR-like, partial [Asbolus verrucosus]